MTRMESKATELIQFELEKCEAAMFQSCTEVTKEVPDAVRETLRAFPTKRRLNQLFAKKNGVNAGSRI